MLNSQNAGVSPLLFLTHAPPRKASETRNTATLSYTITKLVPISSTPTSTLKRHRMASILQLPDEIVLQIFDFCGTGDSKSGKSTYNSLSLVNHRFHGLASPSLYREFPSFGIPDCHSDPWRIGLWARTLLENESKAKLIRAVTIFLPSRSTFHKQTSNGPEQSSLYDMTKSATHTIRNRLATAFQGDLKERAQWEDLCLDQKSVNHILAFVILYLPHLSFLQLYGATWDLWRSLDVLFDGLCQPIKQEGMANPFQELRTVFCGPSECSPAISPCIHQRLDCSARY